MKTDFKLLRGYALGYVWLPYVIAHEPLTTRVQAAADRISVEGRWGIADRYRREPVQTRFERITINSRYFNI